MSYEEFFYRACVFPPYPFQRRFHESDAEFRILEVPTGLGKTNTVVVDWLANRPTTRLVYCLPGRALTRQVAKVAQDLVKQSEMNVLVVELMGGSEDLDLKLSPAQSAILVGTQDVLVSRALNRGYARSPFRWPMDFGLLNNDAMWVFDEVQLLGEVVATGAQMAAFRKRMGAYGRTPCVWMTATLNRSWLKTVDFDQEPVVISLQDDDRAEPGIGKRVTARKHLAETTECSTPRECAAFVHREHRQDKLSLVIANTVGRAQEIWEELGKLGVEDLTLLHSRFRPCDREGIVEKTLKATSGVIVSTQVIEAGVDIDAELMVTDVAPWASLVQRFGRVNRKGDGEGRIFWVRSPQRQKGKAKNDGSEFAPYEPEEVRQAIEVLEQMRSASPGELAGKVKAPAPYRFVLRRTDLLDLFDTTPDLAGNHVDVSRFVRSGEETNVYVAWRKWPEKEAPPKKRLVAAELCPVPHLPGGHPDLKGLLKKQPGWTWNHADSGKWEKVDPDRVYAGMRILLRSEAGGYDPKRGWAPDSKAEVSEYKGGIEAPEESARGDELSEFEDRSQTLAEHTNEVVAELQSLLSELKADLNGTRDSLELAARYHDLGKAHPIFQQTLHGLTEVPQTAPTPLLAKQKRGLANRSHERSWFRHELASALGLLRRDFLAAYLAGAHHGKVRLNIRSMPGEVVLKDARAHIARGIEEGDSLFAADLGGGVEQGALALDLSAMDMGMSDEVKAWSDSVLDLLDKHGPFRLAYLEMLLRAADETASAKANGGKK